MTDSYRHIRVEKGADGVALIILDNADETMNVVADRFITDMVAAIADLRDDATVTGVIVTSGKKAFMAGADLKLMVTGFGRMSKLEAYEFSQNATRMHRALETMGKPVACALNGLALGGGFELALACHYRVLADDPRAIVGLPEVTLGLLPASGGTQRMVRLLGMEKALDLLLSGRSLRPAEALASGLVDALASPDQVIEKARAWLASRPAASQPWDQKGFFMPEMRGMMIPENGVGASMAAARIVRDGGYNVPAPSAILQAVFEGMQMPMDRALSVESKHFANLLTDPVARNIIRTTFISKQAAEKGARRPAGISKTTFGKIGVIGAGMMGSGIALVAAAAGIEVVLIDRDITSAEKGKAYSHKVWSKQVSRGLLAADRMDAMLARITPAVDFTALEGAQLVVEAVFEDADLKAETTRKVEAVIPPEAIYASNTSTLPIDGLANASQRPDRFIGLHFFSPVDRMGLVEVITGRRTAPETLAKALDFVAQIRKTPIVVNDSRGFYTSRVFQTLVFEGAAMLEDGIEPARIENAAKAAGFPVGPLALLDEVTMDLCVKIVEQAIAQKDPNYVIRGGLPVLEKMIALGRGSRKSGAGFYDYPADGPKRLWSGLAENFPSAVEQPGQDELKTRFLYAQAIETARCLEQGVLETPQDADLGSVYGWGFPAWTGGTLSYIDTVGIERFVSEADRLTQAYGERFAPSDWLRARAKTKTDFYPAIGVEAGQARELEGA